MSESLLLDVTELQSGLGAVRVQIVPIVREHLRLVFPTMMEQRRDGNYALMNQADCRLLGGRLVELSQRPDWLDILNA